MTAPALTKDEATRERLLQAAQQLFQQYGLQKVTMEDIARAMGKGKSSLYYYYKSKEEIFEAVLDREIREMLTQVEQAVAEAATVEDKLYAFCLTRLQKLRQKAAFQSVMAGEVLRNIELVHSIRQRYRQRQSDLLRQIFAAAGPCPTAGPADPDALVQLVLSGLHGLGEEVLFSCSNSLATVEPAIRLLCRLLAASLQGQSTPTLCA